MTPTPWPVSCGLPKNEMPVEPPVKWSNFLRIVGSATAIPNVASAR